MDETTYRCQRCGERLNPKKMVWLEMNTQTLLYHEPGRVPEDESQGCFTFGAACARRVLATGGKLAQKRRRA